MLCYTVLQIAVEKVVSYMQAKGFLFPNEISQQFLLTSLYFMSAS